MLVDNKITCTRKDEIKVKDTILEFFEANNGGPIERCTIQSLVEITANVSFDIVNRVLWTLIYQDNILNYNQNGMLVLTNLESITTLSSL